MRPLSEVTSKPLEQININSLLYTYLFYNVRLLIVEQ